MLTRDPFSVANLACVMIYTYLHFVHNAILQTMKWFKQFFHELFLYYIEKFASLKGLLHQSIAFCSVSCYSVSSYTRAGYTHNVRKLANFGET